jgi:hypothetical protein
MAFDGVKRETVKTFQERDEAVRRRSGSGELKLLPYGGAANPQLPERYKNGLLVGKESYNHEAPPLYAASEASRRQAAPDQNIRS